MPCVSRWTYPDFFSRYRVLLKKSQMMSADKKLVCKNLLETLIKVRTLLSSAYSVLLYTEPELWLYLGVGG